jgi:hypothetical protein
MSTHADPIAQLAAIQANELKRSGQIVCRYHTDQQRDQLRAAGRRAGRTLNRPVRTFDHPHPVPGPPGGTVIVVIADWGEHNPLEHRLSQARANNAIERALTRP